jgi:hypothetical protein
MPNKTVVFIVAQTFRKNTTWNTWFRSHEEGCIVGRTQYWRALLVIFTKEPRLWKNFVGKLMKSAFDFWDENGELEFHEEDVRIYQMDGEQYLFVGQVLYACTAERDWYGHNVFPHAKGRCLEIGLGLGVASKVILANPRVTHLLTIEKDENVITAFGKPLHKHNILHADVPRWASNLIAMGPRYDLIFVDHYTFEEEELGELEELATKLRQVLADDGRMIFWIDENAPDEDRELIKKLWI